MSKSKKRTKSSMGKLIVVDGTDGSGKATQVELLRKRLIREGYKVKVVDFPEYYKNFFGAFIGHCLAEQYYNWVNIHPKIASIAYAADRFESKDEINGWLEKGYIVISNRYVSANQIHQGGKIASAKKREAFLEWLDTMEHNVFKIPRPDVVIYLSLKIPTVLRLIRERDAQNKRIYLGNKKDVHERDSAFLQNSRKSALWLTHTLPYFKKVNCDDKKNGILSREEIQEMVFDEVKKIIKK